MSDKDIILLLQSQPSEGLRTAIDQYGRLVRTVIARILPRHPQDVEECVEDTFVKVWQGIAHVNPDTATFKAYLLGAARNIAISRYRQLKRSNVIPLEGSMEPAVDDISDAVLGSQTTEELKRLIVAMEEPDRGILFRRYFLFESREQIARATGLDAVQVKNRLYRGKQRLRKQLEERGITHEAV